jgi:NADPH-dependent 2,4-dienoyl-CoA reductase/sulfur reductase-like enzyme
LLKHKHLTDFRSTKANYIMATQDPLSSLEGDMLDVAPGVKQVKGDIAATSHIERLPNVANEDATDPAGNGSSKEVQHCDVLVVGAGFSTDHCFARLSEL